MVDGEDLLQVEEIIDSCVVEGGKRLYHVKWKSIWVSGDQLPIKLIENAEGEKAMSDGVYVFLDERKNKEGIEEYLLSYSSTWEPEKKLIVSCSHLLSSFWSSSSGARGINDVKEEDDGGNEVTYIKLNLNEEQVVVEDNGYTKVKYEMLDDKGKHSSFEKESSKHHSNGYRPLFLSLSDMHENDEHIYEENYSPNGKNIYISKTLPEEETSSNEDNFNHYNESNSNSKFNHFRNLDLNNSDENISPKKRLCEECGKYFSTKSNLNRHRKKCCGGKLFYCEICGENFSLSFALIIHQRSHAKDILPSDKVNSCNDRRTSWNNNANENLMSQKVDSIYQNKKLTNSQINKISQHQKVKSRNDEIIPNNENINKIQMDTILLQDVNSRNDEIIPNNENINKIQMDTIILQDVNSRNDEIIPNNENINKIQMDTILLQDVNARSDNTKTFNSKVNSDNENINLSNDVDPINFHGSNGHHWNNDTNSTNNTYDKNSQKKNTICDDTKSLNIKNSGTKRYTFIEYQKVPSTSSVEKKYKCAKCCKQFSTKSNLNRHCKTCSVDELLNLEVCGASFARCFNLKPYDKLHRNEPLYQRDMCNLQSTSNLAVNEQLEMEGGRCFKNTTRCDMSDKQSKTAYKRRLPVHEKPIIPNNTSNTNLSKSDPIQKYQQDDVAGERRYDCKKCDKQFSTKSNLNRHVKSCNGGKIFNCEICDSPFTRIVNLKIHQRIHTNENKNQCSVCKKQCLTSYALLEHERVHTGVKPFKCSTCGRQFTTKSNWKRHQLMYACKKKCGPHNTQLPNIEVAKHPNLQDEQRIKNEEVKEQITDSTLQPLTSKELTSDGN